MKSSRNPDPEYLSNAQRRAINDINEKLSRNLPETPYRECSYQNVICERSNLDFLQFAIPHGAETINKIYFRKSNVLALGGTDNPVFPSQEPLQIRVELHAEFTEYNAATTICLATFVIPSFDTKIVLSGEAFPIFMFPKWRFSIKAYTNVLMQKNFIQDIDLIVGTIIMSKQFAIKKMKTLNNLFNKPGLYKFRNVYLKSTLQQQQSAAPPKQQQQQQPLIASRFESLFAGRNKKVPGASDFADPQVDIIIACDIGDCGDCNDANAAGIMDPMQFSSKLEGIIKNLFNPNNGNNDLLNATHEPKNVAVADQQENEKEKHSVVLPHKRLNYNLRSISDLLQIIDEVPIEETKQYSFSIDIAKLHKIKGPLERLNAMVGLTKIKEDLIDWILYFISNLPKSTNTQFMNIALYGSPGVGKTHISEILADILSQIGAIKNNKVAKVSAPDLIGPYVGHSEMLTKNFLKANKGSVIVIDEAYSIARSPSQDFCTYGVKVLDIINQFLSENTDTIMIVCGYKDLLEKYFFNANKGLNRRFPWGFTLEQYTPKELYQIMVQKIKEFNYEVILTDVQSQEIIEKIRQNKDSLKSNVGDIINIISKAQSMHARQILTYEPDEIKKMKGHTIVQACNNYIDGVRNNNKDSTPPEGMYH